MKNITWLKSKIEKYSKNEAYILEGKILDITEQISIRLQELGWSKKDLAEKMNVSQALVTKLLNGRNNYTLKTLVKLSEILDLNLEVNMVREEETILNWFELKPTEAVNNVTIECNNYKPIWIESNPTLFKGIFSESNYTALKPSNQYAELN